ncbi:unnamed protein product, partial [Heterosigma akashiwo]
HGLPAAAGVPLHGHQAGRAGLLPGAPRGGGLDRVRAPGGREDDRGGLRAPALRGGRQAGPWRWTEEPHGRPSLELFHQRGGGVLPRSP